MEGSRGKNFGFFYYLKSTYHVVPEKDFIASLRRVSAVRPIEKIDDDPAKFRRRFHVNPVARIWNRQDFKPRKPIPDSSKIVLLNVIRIAASDEASGPFEGSLRFYRLSERIVVFVKRLKMHAPLKTAIIVEKIFKHKLAHPDVGNVLSQC